MPEHIKGFYKRILDDLYEGVYFCDAERRITYWNKAAEKITGYSESDVCRTACYDNILNHTNDKGRRLCREDTCPAVRAMKEQRLVEEEIFIRHKKGHRVPVITRISPMKDDAGKVIGAIEIFSENSAKISAFRKIEQLKKLAFIDSLTGTGNRRYTEIKIEIKLSEMEKYSWFSAFGLIFADVDDFKKINDDYGHEAGDKVLQTAAKTLMGNIREEDFVGRWGGEEFVIIISDADGKKLYAVAEKLRSLVEQSVAFYGGASINATISAGAVISKRGEGISELMKRADELMYESKKAGKNTVKTE
ncbi:MAG: diguanylate cyclase [Candidatus Goldiibacteriota bacterium]